MRASSTHSSGRLPAHIRHALHRGPVPEPLLPAIGAAAENLFGGAAVVEDGFALTADGAMLVAARTDMPGVTPPMIDWWFGWHSDSPERYKLWHPHAHVHAVWLAPPAAGTRGRARYVGHTSVVDEYIGSNLIRAAIRFVVPATLGFTDSSLDDPEKATIVCARTGFGDFSIDVGYLVHHVRQTAAGSEMRSRFWVGGPYAAGRSSLAGTVIARAARLVLRPIEADASARCWSIAPKRCSIWQAFCRHSMRNSDHGIKALGYARTGTARSSAETQSAIGHPGRGFFKMAHYVV